MSTFARYGYRFRPRRNLAETGMFPKGIYQYRDVTLRANKFTPDAP